MTSIDIGVLSFVVGTLLFTGIWYLKEQAELPNPPAPEPPHAPLESQPVSLVGRKSDQPLRYWIH